MALSRFMYDDPSKCVDHIRCKRKQHEANQKQNKADRAKEGLEQLFNKGETLNEQK